MCIRYVLSFSMRRGCACLFSLEGFRLRLGDSIKCVTDEAVGWVVFEILRVHKGLQVVADGCSSERIFYQYPQHEGTRHGIPWRSVSLQLHHFKSMSAGDCELASKRCWIVDGARGAQRYSSM
jgi:hypothetical protein